MPAREPKIPQDLKGFYQEAYEGGKAPDQPDPSDTVQSTPPADSSASPALTVSDSQQGTDIKPSDKSTVQPDTSGQNEELFEKKYKTLMGKYNAEVPALNKKVTERDKQLQQQEQMIRLMQDKMDNLTKQVDKLNAAGGKSKDTPDEENEPERKPSNSIRAGAGSLITDDDTTEFGESIVDFVMRAAKQVFLDNIDPYIRPFRDELLDIRRSQARTNEERFFFDLQEKIPNLAELNDDVGFNAWLDELNDEFSGLTRRNILDAALRDFDVQRTAKLFHAYTRLIESGGIQPQRNTGAGEPNSLDDMEIEVIKPKERQPQSSTPSLDSMVSPPPSRGEVQAQPPSSAQKRYTVQDFEDLNELVRARKITPAEFERKYREMVLNS